MPPKPGPPQVKRWYQERPSPFSWEQSALNHISGRMPRSAPHYAWACFSFTARSGRINECDLFIAVPRGLYLVELKGHQGRVGNNSDTWGFRTPDGRVRTIRNPLNLTDLKAKELKDRLLWAARDLYPGLRIPRIDPLIFLSDPHLHSDLDEVQRAHVYGMDGAPTGLPGIWDDFLGRPPERESSRVTENFTRFLPELMKKIGVSASTRHLDFGDGWRLSPRPLDAGPTWEDRLARRKDPIDEEGRVRVYLVELQADEERRRSTTRAALREYQVLQGINHRGIAQAVDFRHHQGGPAILFRHRASDLRLDNYLARHGAGLSDAVRRDMVRQLAEAVRYAHRRSLYHRALAARSVYVSARENGSRPVLRIIDWQASARDFDTTSLRSLGESAIAREHLEDAAQGYLAPESDTEFPDPVELDIFGLGAVAYHILTGMPPADSRGALSERLQVDDGLHLYAVSDSADSGLDELVYAATRRLADDRLDSADAFLDLLDQAERATAAARAAAVEADPLTATAGQLIDGVDGDWTVVRVLGVGATARALYVRRLTEDNWGHQEQQERVLKIALDAEKNDRLEAEARALRLVGGGPVVRLYDARRIGPRTVLELEYAGPETLAQRLRSKGRLSFEQLRDFGDHLFNALDRLAAKGVRHRDLKPANFGVQPRRDGREQLMLFDFSLAEASDRDTRAGTRGYLDPFIGTPRRPAYDDHAEWYGAAVVLHEMASGERPLWGDGGTEAVDLNDETPHLFAESFEQSLRPGLESFFRRALHRDAGRRYDSLRQMQEAWRDVFRVAEATKPSPTKDTLSVTGLGGLSQGMSLDETRDLYAERASLDTPLEQAGLTPLAQDAAADFGATTVGELLDIPLYRFQQKRRGIGIMASRELRRRHRQWTMALRTKKPAAAPAKSRPAARTSGEDEQHRAATALLEAQLPVEQLAELLTPAPAGRKDNRLPQVIAAYLGLPAPDGTPESVRDLPPWATGRSVADALGIRQITVSKHLTAVSKEWAAAGWMSVLRDELVEIVREAGRIMTARELAVELRARHGAGGDSAERMEATALAVIRAALAAEKLLTGGDAGHEPRLADLRRRGGVLIAMESLEGSNDPTSEELADYAIGLGKRAEKLAATDPLTDRPAILRDLRGVRAPEGMAPLPDARLIQLAAAASQTAGASPRLELYPKTLGLARALAISQAAAGVRQVGISLEGLLARLRSRFPEIRLGSPTYVEVEEALKQAGFPLTYDTKTDRFLPPAPPAVTGASWLTRTSSVTASNVSPVSRTATASVLTEKAAEARKESEPWALLTAKLTAAARQGGFLALNVDVQHLRGAADLIAVGFPVQPVNLAELFLAEFRSLAGEHGTAWPQVLSADTRFTRTGLLPGGLRSYVSRVWPRVAARLAAMVQEGDRTVLFLHTAGLVSHYYEAGGHDLLMGLQRSARQPGALPHGLWLLTPTRNPRGVPVLDGRTVEITGGDAERAVLTQDYLRKLEKELKSLGAPIPPRNGNAG